MIKQSVELAIELLAKIETAAKRLEIEFGVGKVEIIVTKETHEKLQPLFKDNPEYESIKDGKLYWFEYRVSKIGLGIADWIVRANEDNPKVKEQ